MRRARWTLNAVVIRIAWAIAMPSQMSLARCMSMSGPKTSGANAWPMSSPEYDDAVDAARRVGRRGALDDDVARRPGDAGGHAHQREQHRDDERRHGGEADRQGDQRRDAEPGADDLLASRRIGGEEAAEQHADGARDHVERQAHRRPAQRHVVKLARRLGRERLHAADHHGIEEEEAEAHPYRGDGEEGEVAGRAGRVGMRLGGDGAGHLFDAEVRAADPQRHDDGDDERTRRGECDAPRRGERDGHHHRRRERPAEAPGDAVHGERVAEPRSMDLAIEQRVVDRMKDAVADAGNHRESEQHRIAGARCEAEGGDGEQGQAAEQDRARTEVVDDEARERLHAARDDEEDRQHEAELGEADVERVLEQEEERRQQQLAEMADAVREADQAHDLEVGTGRGGEAVTLGTHCGERRGRGATAPS